MEEKQKKPISMVEPTINDLPNEILAMIFSLMTFEDRIQASLVCHLWNDVIFNFSDVFLALNESRDLRMIRSYKHVEIRSLKDLHYTFGESLREAIEPVAEGVQSLHLYIDKLKPATFTTILQKFCHIKELHLLIEHYNLKEGQEVEVIPLPSLEKLFLQKVGFEEIDSTKLVLYLKQMLEANTTLRYLDIECLLAPEFVDLLEICAHQLFSLHLTVRRIVIDNFCTLSFTFLKVLLLQVMDSHITCEETELIYSIASLEELTIINFNAEPLSMDGVWRLSKLKKFRANVLSMHFPKILKPMPHVSHLGVPYDDFSWVTPEGRDSGLNALNSHS